MTWGWDLTQSLELWKHAKKAMDGYIYGYLYGSWMLCKKGRDGQISTSLA